MSPESNVLMQPAKVKSSPVNWKLTYISCCTLVSCLRDCVQSSMSKKNVNRWCLGEGGSRPKVQLKRFLKVLGDIDFLCHFTFMNHIFLINFGIPVTGLHMHVYSYSFVQWTENSPKSVVLKPVYSCTLVSCLTWAVTSTAQWAECFWECDSQAYMYTHKGNSFHYKLVLVRIEQIPTTKSGLL